MNLHVVALSGLEDHVPELGLDGVVDAVFGFIDEQETVGAVGERQGYGKTTHRSITETS